MALGVPYSGGQPGRVVGIDVVVATGSRMVGCTAAGGALTVFLAAVAVFTRGSTDGRLGALNCETVLMVGCSSSGTKWDCVAAVGVAATCTIASIGCSTIFSGGASNVGLLRGGTRMAVGLNSVCCGSNVVGKRGDALGMAASGCLTVGECCCTEGQVVNLVSVGMLIVVELALLPSIDLGEVILCCVDGCMD